MIGVESKGDHDKTSKRLKKLLDGDIFSGLDSYGRMGVAALSRATPTDTGESRNSWGYRLIKSKTYPGIEWFNTNVTTTGQAVVILIQYGHGTGTGGYVAGRDFINPAMRPIFDKIAADVWKKVIS